MPDDAGAARRRGRRAAHPANGSAVPPTASAWPPPSSLLVLGLVVADLAAGTRGAVEQDLTDATSGLPRLLLTLLGWMSGIGVLLLPIGVGADLLVRRRPMQLIQALGAAVVGGVLVIVLAVLVQSGNGGFVTDVLTRPTSTGRTGPLDIVIVSMLALLTVADISGRKWISPIATIVVIATLVTTLLSGAMTLAALACSLLVGWIVGLAFRLVFGVTSTRPPGHRGGRGARRGRRAPDPPRAHRRQRRR